MGCLTNVIGRSAFSRGEPFRIGDKKSEYFQKCGVTDTIDSNTRSLYLRLFELVGGRFEKLDEAVRKINMGVSFEGIFPSVYFI